MNFRICNSTIISIKEDEKHRILGKIWSFNRAGLRINEYILKGLEMSLDTLETH